MFDQEVGGTYAAQFLRSLYAELGTWSAAAGAYHSRTPEFARSYRGRFDRIYAGLGGTPLTVAEASPGTPEAASPRPSRTRMSARPKIITLAAGPALAGPAADAVAAISVKRGTTPRAAAAAAGGIVLSARDAPL